VATDNAWGRFRQWRWHRPFWGGLFLILAGLELFFSANLTLADMEVHFGQDGYLSYLLPIILLICGALAWATPAQRLFYGIIGLVTALYSFLGLNLGGFGIGMLIGIVGGALTIAWGPPRTTRATGTAADTEPSSQSPSELDDAETDDAFDGETRPDHDITIAGSDLPPRAPYASDPPTEILPGFGDDQPDPARPAKNGSVHRKAFVITLVPLLVSAMVLIAGGHTPARAAPCPDGLPSRPAAEAKREAARQSAPKKKAAATAKPRSSSPKAPAKPKAPDEQDKADPDGKATPSASPSTDGSGNPIVDGWNDFVDGVEDLVGIGDDATPSPTPTPSAEPSTTAPAPAQPTPTGTAGPTVPGDQAPSTPSGSASPTPSPSDVPCLGPRVFKEAGPDDVPRVSIKGGLLEADTLTMYDATYNGTVDLTTANGTIKALKFSMGKAVNDGFRLTIPEAGGHTTLIKSDQLITDKNVKFYTPSIEGKLFGVFPVTYTPELPPPLTPPIVWFTDVKINLAFVRCDTLTAKPILITEK
jgi:hypothetical protein